jgi:hypothetical protein
VPTALGGRPTGSEKSCKTKIDVALFSEPHLKPHMRYYISHFYRTDHEDEHKGKTAVAVKKGIANTCVDLPPLLSVKATGVCIPIGNTEILFAAVHKFPQRLWSYTDVTELLVFRNKSILVGDLNKKHPVGNSKISNPSGLKSQNYTNTSIIAVIVATKTTAIIKSAIIGINNACKMGDHCQGFFRSILYMK